MAPVRRAARTAAGRRGGNLHSAPWTAGNPARPPRPCRSWTGSGGRRPGPAGSPRGWPRHVMKPLPPAWATARERAVISGSSGRGNGILSMTTSRQELARDVDALPQRHGAEQAGVRFVGKLLHQRRHGWIRPGTGCSRPAACALASAASSAARREENRPGLRRRRRGSAPRVRRAASGEVPRPGLGRCAGHVQDALPGVVEGASRRRRRSSSARRPPAVRARRRRFEGGADGTAWRRSAPRYVPRTALRAAGLRRSAGRC